MDPLQCTAPTTRTIRRERFQCFDGRVRNSLYSAGLNPDAAKWSSYSPLSSKPKVNSPAPFVFDVPRFLPLRVAITDTPGIGCPVESTTLPCTWRTLGGEYTQTSARTAGPIVTERVKSIMNLAICFIEFPDECILLAPRQDVPNRFDSEFQGFCVGRICTSLMKDCASCVTSMATTEAIWLG